MDMSKKEKKKEKKEKKMKRKKDMHSEKEMNFCSSFFRTYLGACESTRNDEGSLF